MQQAAFETWLNATDTIIIGNANVEITASQGEMVSASTASELLNSQFGSLQQVDLRRTDVIARGNEPQDIGFDDGDAEEHFIASLLLSNFDRPILLYNFSAKLISMTNSNSNATISLKNIMVNTLDVGPNSGANFIIEDCYIGRLILARGCSNDFTIRGGVILDIRTPSPLEINPFTGSVCFENSCTLPSRTSPRFAGPQPYRNLRSHMTKLENAPMVSRFYRLEQLIERETFNLVDRFLSRSYSTFSDYGNSTVRPFLALGILFVAFSVVLFLSNGAIPSAESSSAGWQRMLTDHGIRGQIHRAVWFAGQSTLNPIGIFGPKTLLVAKNELLEIYLLINSLLSAVLFALGIFAIRRRFKMTSSLPN